MSLKFIIDSGILTSYPRVKIGVLVGRDAKVEGRNSILEDLKAQAISEAKGKIGSEPVTKHPFIASWREMYRSFGTRPGDYRPSAEALLRRALRGRGLPSINTAVDAYNAVSLRHLIPMGGFDLDRVRGAIRLRFSGGGEPFQPLGQSGPEETYEGEPVYSDDARVLTRRWNHRDCDETKITLETVNLAMFIDGSQDVPVEAVEMAVDDLTSLLERCCRGVFVSAIADGSTLEVSL